MTYNEFVEGEGLVTALSKLFTITCKSGNKLALKSVKVHQPSRNYNECLIYQEPYSYSVDIVTEFVEGKDKGKEFNATLSIPKMCERGFLIKNTMDSYLKWRVPINIGTVDKMIMVRGYDNPVIIIRGVCTIYLTKTKDYIPSVELNEYLGLGFKSYNLFNYLKSAGFDNLDGYLNDYGHMDGYEDIAEDIPIPAYKNRAEKIKNKYIQLTHIIPAMDMENPKITPQMIYELVKAFKTDKNRFESYSPLDIDFKNFQTTLFYDELIYNSGVKGKIAYELDKYERISSDYLSHIIVNVFNLMGEENAVQVGAMSNALTFISQSNKVYIKSWDKDAHDVIKKPIHYTDDFYGVICPAKTPESVGLCGIKNELASSTKIIDDVIYVDVMDKKGDPVRLKYIDYFTSRILLSDFFDYDDFLVKPNKYGVLKILQFGEFKTVKPSMDEFDYIMATPESGLAINSGLIPFMNRSDGTRLAMSTNMEDQAIPIVGGQRSIITTKIAKSLYAESDLNWKSTVDGIVEEVYNGYVKVRAYDGKIIIYGTPDGFTTSVHSCNLFKPAVKVGDYVRVGDVIMESNSFNGKNLALTVPLKTIFYEKNSLSNEDALIISDRAAEAFGHEVVEKIYIDIPAGTDFVFNKELLVAKLAEIANNPYLLTRAGLSEPPRIGEYEELNQFGLPLPGHVYYENEILGMYMLEPQDPLRKKLTDITQYNKSEKITRYDVITKRIPYGKDKCKVESVELFYKPSIALDPRYKELIEYYDKLKAAELEDLIEHLGNYTFPKFSENLRDGNPLDPDVRIVIKVSYIAACKIGDKIANRYGGKGTISAIYPLGEMPRIGGPDGEPVDIYMPSESVINRKNLSQIYEANLAELCKLAYAYNEQFIKEKKFDEVKNVLNMLYVTDRFSSYNRLMLKEFHAQFDGYYVLEVGAIDSKYTNKVISDLNKYFGYNTEGDSIYLPNLDKTARVKVTHGTVEFMRLHFKVEDKAKATSNLGYVDELAMGQGHGRVEGQRLGQMEVWNLTAYDTITEFYRLNKPINDESNDDLFDAESNHINMQMLLVGLLRVK